MEMNMSDRPVFQCLRQFGLLCLMLTSLAMHAQMVPMDPDWQESDAPAPPQYSRDKLLALEMPPYVTLQFGIDPATLAITPDGIVRYVVVASNAGGSVSAFYEGIRCATGEVKTYARSNSGGGWTLVKDAPWRGLKDNQPSKHALAFARQAACEGATTARSAADIIRAMKK
jgi:hypothetical protein